MKKIFCVLGLMVMICMFSAASLQAAINVPGDYATIQAAINAAAPGETINVAAGIYHEQITINKPLTINGADGAVLDGTPTLLTPPLAATAWTTGVKIKSGNVTFNNIDVTNFRQDGIIIGYESSTPGSLKNVQVTNCKISNIQPGNHGFGIYAGYQSEDFKRPYLNPRLTAHLDYSGLLIENNEITNTKSSALVLQSITGTPGTLIVRNNNIHGGLNDGIWIDCARNIVIQDNIVAGNMDGFYISSYADNYIANSTSAWIYENPWMPHLNGPYSPENILIIGNTISDSIKYGGVYLESAHPATISINRNSITGNTPGVANYLSEPVNTTCNWWGVANGPGPVGPGSGDGVSIYVNYDPWSTISTFVSVDAGTDQTIYLGYSPQSATLTATAVSCGDVTYLWSNGATTQSITVTPATTTTYDVTVTDDGGNVYSDSVKVNVIDVRCGNKNDKVSVCHKDKQKNSLCINANAVPAHLAHGDSLGVCR